MNKCFIIDSLRIVQIIVPIVALKVIFIPPRVQKINVIQNCLIHFQNEKEKVLLHNMSYCYLESVSTSNDSAQEAGHEYLIRVLK